MNSAGFIYLFLHMSLMAWCGVCVAIISKEKEAVNLSGTEEGTWEGLEEREKGSYDGNYIIIF